MVTSADLPGMEEHKSFSKTTSSRNGLFISPMSGLIIAFIVAGVLLVLFTKFDYSHSLVHYYHEEEDFSHIIPSSVNAKLTSASSLVHSQKMHYQVLPYIEQMREKSPSNDTLHYYAGICYFKINEPAEAIQCFQRVYRNSGGLLKQKAHFRLGLSIWQSGELAKAKFIFEQISRQAQHPYREKAAQILKEKVFSTIKRS